jgi:hypothetical protein
MWLQCQEEYDCLAEFNPEEGILKKHSRKILGSHASKIENVDGWFSEATYGTFMLFKNKNRIYFSVYGTEFMLDDKTAVEVSGPRTKRLLQVIHEDKVIFETYYTPIGEGMIKGDPTPFIEDEDFDFGLFVSNISKNPKRKDVFLGKA